MAWFGSMLSKSLASLAISSALLNSGFTSGFISEPASSSESYRCSAASSHSANHAALDYPWHLAQLNISAAHKFSTGKGVKIALIDTGFDSTGSWFDPALVVAENFLPLTPDEVSRGVDCGHATAIGSLIGATRKPNPGIGVSTPSRGISDRSFDQLFHGSLSIAPDATIYSLRAIGSSGTGGVGEVNATTAAIHRAIALDVDLINLSLVTGTDFPQLRAAIDAARNSGIVVVAAAGNSDDGLADRPRYPASYPGVISVGATDISGKPSDVSANTSSGSVTVGAPGVDIQVVLPGGSSGVVSGSSFAAGIVTGTVALMISYRESLIADSGKSFSSKALSPAQISQILVSTAYPTAASAPNTKVGYGVIDPVAAISTAGSYRNLATVTDPHTGKTGDAVGSTGRVGFSSSASQNTDTHLEDDSAEPHFQMTEFQKTLQKRVTSFRLIRSFATSYSDNYLLVLLAAIVGLFVTTNWFLLKRLAS